MSISIKSNKLKTLFIIIMLILFCSIMYYVDAILALNYVSKSTFKVLLCIFLPIIYFHFDRSFKVLNLFKISSKNQIKASLILGCIVYSFILLMYYIFRNFIDLNYISTLLNNDLSINENNFIFVFFYIALINSLLEEFFFRGFIFCSLKNNSNRLTAYIVSSLGFAIYHIGIVQKWFSFIVFLLIFIGLIFAGMLFNYLNERNNGTIYNSWFVHMFANFSINTIGILMFISN